MVPTNYQNILSSSRRMLFKHDSASWMLAWLCGGMFQHFCWGMMMELVSLSSSIIYCLKPTTKQQSANYVLGPSGNLRGCFFCSPPAWFCMSKYVFYVDRFPRAGSTVKVNTVTCNVQWVGGYYSYYNNNTCKCLTGSCFR